MVRVTSRLWINFMSTFGEIAPRWTPRKSFNTLRPRQNGRHFADDFLKRIFFNENVWISLKILLKFVTKVQINNIPALVPIMAWRRPGDKPVSEAMMDCLLTHICITRPQWVTDKSILVLVMVCCPQATRQYLSQCWPKSLSPCGANDQLLVYKFCDCTTFCKWLTVRWYGLKYAFQLFQNIDCAYIPFLE